MSGADLKLTANLQQSAEPFKVLAFYKFVDHSGILSWQPELAKFCCARGIRGTIILAPEGINGTVAGHPAAIDELMDFLRDDPLFDGALAGAEIKVSRAAEMPFLRMRVRLKPEIVTLRAPEAKPALRGGTRVAAEDWNQLIARDDVLLIDTRNGYEVGLGSFEGAVDPGTRNFTEFKHYVAEHLDPARDRKIAMFCTGGIRCEKASSYLLSQGFEEVFQLQGGILKYLATVPEAESRFAGECFVFDERVAVTHGLVEGDAALCRACRTPLSAEDRALPGYVEGVSCRHCAGDTGKQQAAAERQRQMQLARTRGHVHLGAGAVASAAHNRAVKRVRRATPAG